MKQVAEVLVRDTPSLKTYVTLSPAPTFARWRDRALAAEGDGLVSPEQREVLSQLRDPRWVEIAAKDGPGADELKSTLLSLAAHYFLMAKSADDRPVDPVARFHLGNGARLERLNWLGDTSERGLREGHGLTVNYCYDLDDIERNHEAYVQDGTVVAARAVRSLLKARQVRGRSRPPSAPGRFKDKEGAPVGFRMKARTCLGDVP